jgi:hypothetical protein
MSFQEYLEKLETIKYMIKYKRAGTPHCLSEKLNVSERTLDRMIRLLKGHGCPIVVTIFVILMSYQILKRKTSSAIFWRWGYLALFNIYSE